MIQETDAKAKESTTRGDTERSISSPLEIAEGISKIIAAVAIPIVLLVVGNDFSESQKNKDIAQNYVEIAVGILAKPPTEDTTKLRAWAVQVVNRYSEIEISRELSEDLIMREALPLQVQRVPREGFRPFNGDRPVDRIVISDTQQNNVDVELKALDEIGVSYHYLVTESGTILGLVDENDVAFHTSGHNQDSIGIGVMHVSGEEYPPAQVLALTQLIRDLATRHDIPSESIVGKAQLDPRRNSDFSKISEVVRGAL